MASTALNYTFTLEPPDLFDRVEARLSDRVDLMQRVGALAMSVMQDRLAARRSTSNEAATGRLSASLSARMPGGGSADSHFEVGPGTVSVGSNLEYANQVDVGGTIFPRNGKALAIPADGQVARSRKWPRDFPRDALAFVPAAHPGNTIGYLFDVDGKSGFGRGTMLYTLVHSVTQPGLHFAGWDDEMRATIENHIWPQWMEGLKHGV